MKHHPILSVKARWVNFAVRHFKYTPYYSGMKRIHNTHVGESCFVIGNGPSLTAADLDTLAENHIDSFAMAFAPQICCSIVFAYYVNCSVLSRLSWRYKQPPNG